MVALTGITSRVSSRSELSDYMEVSNALEDEAPDWSSWSGHGMTRPLMWSCVTSAVGAFVCGFHLGDLNTPAGVMREALGVPPLLREHHGVVALSTNNDALWGMCVSMIAVGALGGSHLAERLAAWRGRRAAIAIAAALFVLGAVLRAMGALESQLAAPLVPWHTISPPTHEPPAPPLPNPPPLNAAPPAPHHPRASHHKAWASRRPHAFSRSEPAVPLLLLLAISRLIAGVGVGISSTVLPVYLGELAPPYLRGSVGAAVAVASAIGVGASHVLGLLLTHSASSVQIWVAHPLLVAILSLVQLMALRWLPESPLHLLVRGHVGRAAEQLARLRGHAVVSDDVADELRLMAGRAQAMRAAMHNDTAEMRAKGSYLPPTLASRGALACGASMGTPGTPSAVSDSWAVRTASFESVNLTHELSHSSLAGGLLGGLGTAQPPGSSVHLTRLAEAAGMEVGDLREELLRAPIAASPSGAEASGLGSSMKHLTAGAPSAMGREANASDAAGRHAQPIVLCAAVMCAQQLSGVGFTTCYSFSTLRDVGVSTPWSVVGVLLHDAIGIGVTALATRILDATGRRPLLIGSLIATATALVALSIGLRLTAGAPDTSLVGPPLACASLALHAAAFGVGLGPVPWLLPNEIVDASRQPRANRLTASTHWIASAVAAQTFLPLGAWLGPWCLLPNVGVLLLILTLAMLLAPETRGKLIETIQHELAFATGPRRGHDA